MADFADSAAAAVDVELVVAPAAAHLAPALPAGEQLLEANLYSVCELVAARASSARQYGAIYRRSCDALRDELHRPPVVADLTADAITAYSRALERRGGRGGGPASPATRRAPYDAQSAVRPARLTGPRSSVHLLGELVDGVGLQVRLSLALNGASPEGGVPGMTFEIGGGSPAPGALTGGTRHR